MKVLQIVTLISPTGAYGGPTAVAIQQCSELRRRDTRVELVAGWIERTPAPATWMDSPITSVRLRPWIPGANFAGLMSWTWLRAVWAALGRADVVHVHFSRDIAILLAVTLARMRRVPFVLQTHGMIAPDRRRRSRVLDRLLVVPALHRAASVLHLTPLEAEALSSISRGQATLGRLVNGVAVAEPKAPRDADVPVVLFAARLHPRKRVLQFAQAAAQLTDSGVKASFIVAGPDQGDLPALTQLIASSSLVDVLRYVGPKSPAEMSALLAAVDLYVLPSVAEPFPMSALEAMAVGTPVVITTDCGLADMFTESGAARVIEPSLPGLTAAMGELIQDKDLRETYGITGQSFVHDNLSIATVVDRLCDIYSEAIGND
jgi:glycosyltransferase involved in cell wall biosynthesis